MLEPARDARARPPLAPLLLAAGFLLARLGYHLLGVRFNASPLDAYWQFVDPFLLRREPIVSILHLHSQPPLFNLLLALALLPGRELAPVVLQVALLACGALLTACVYALQRRLGVPAAIAAATSLAFAASPAFVLHESWLFYALPTAALLALSCLAFAAAAAGSRRGLHLCLWSAALLCLLRAAFHPLWYALLALALALSSAERRRVARAALGPALLLGCFLAKNALLFGAPALSSWVGQGLSRLTVERLAPEERSALVGEGRLSEAARAPSFSPPESYPEDMMAADPSLPRVLSQQRKSAGAVNYHAIGYLRVSRALLADSLWVIVHRPGVYLSGMVEAWSIYFRSPCAVPFFGIANRRATAGLCEAQDRWLLARRRPGAGGARPDSGVCLAILILSPLLVALAAGGALGRGPLAGRPLPERALLGLLAANVAYVAAVGNALEIGENNRFRFETDGLSVVLLGAGIARLCGWLATRSAASGAD
ncbi:MAG: hypothetical protein AB7O37_04785 [Vicinamibacteria bacterium]